MVKVPALSHDICFGEPPKGIPVQALLNMVHIPLYQLQPGNGLLVHAYGLLFLSHTLLNPFPSGFHGPSAAHKALYFFQAGVHLSLVQDIHQLIDVIFRIIPVSVIFFPGIDNALFLIKPQGVPAEPHHTGHISNQILSFFLDICFLHILHPLFFIFPPNRLKYSGGLVNGFRESAR